MKRNYWAMGVGVLMMAAGWVRKSTMRGLALQDPVLHVQQWTLLAGGALVLGFAWLAAKRPRNAGFAVTLVSLAVLMSGATAVPFHQTETALPGIVLGVAGLAAGIYCMAATRMGDS